MSFSTVMLVVKRKGLVEVVVAAKQMHTDSHMQHTSMSMRLYAINTHARAALSSWGREHHETRRRRPATPVPAIMSYSIAMAPPTWRYDAAPHDEPPKSGAHQILAARDDC